MGGNNDIENNNNNEDKIMRKLVIENIEGNFLENKKIILDPHGLNIIKSVQKDGTYFFGKELKYVNVYYFYYL
jgi:hypothetical protein